MVFCTTPIDRGDPNPQTNPDTSGRYGLRCLVNSEIYYNQISERVKAGMIKKPSRGKYVLNVDDKDDKDDNLDKDDKDDKQTDNSNPQYERVPGEKVVIVNDVIHIPEYV